MMLDVTTLLDKLTHLFADNRHPTIVEIADQFSSLLPEETCVLLQEDQRLRSQLGRLLPVEDYLKCFADSLDSSAQLDLIYHEFVLNEESGSSAVPAEYLKRFPQYKEQLSRQFELHRVLNSGASGSTKESAAIDTIPRKTSRDTRLPRLDGFRIDSVLGQGAMGIVYEATDLAVDRKVAIKMLLGGLASRSEDVQRLRNEAAAIAQLRHSHIVALYQVAEHEGLPYLVMEKVEGQTLALLLQNGPLPVDEVLRMMEPVCDAIAFANSHRVIHRDLKPANILLNQNRTPFVTDFGLARLVSDDPHVSGNIVGTPQYMSPEQARGEAITPASDVYALGVILYEMLSGRPPFQAATAWDVLSQILQRDAPRLRELNSTIPLDLQTICEKCLAKDPEQRYTTATELHHELIRFREGRPILAKQASTATRCWKWCRRNPAIASLVSLSVILMCVLTGGALITASRLSKANNDIRSQSERALKAEADALKDREAVVDSFNSLVNDLYQELSTKTGTMRQRDAIIRTSLAGLQKIANRSTDRDVDENLIIALLRMGDLHALTGNDSEALKNFDSAIATCEELLEKQPDDYDILMHLATAFNSNGMLQFRRGSMTEASSALQQSAEILSELIRKNPGVYEAFELAVSTSNVLTDIIWTARGDHLKFSADGVKLADGLLAKFPMERDTNVAAALSYQRNGRALLEAGMLPAAIERYQRAHELLESARELSPADDQLFSTFLINQRLLANALAMSGKTSEALVTIQHVISGMVQLSDEDPSSVPGAQEVVLAYLSQSLIYESNGDQKSSYQSLLQAKLESTECMILNPATTQFSTSYCQVCLQLAMAELELNQNWQAAEGHLDDFQRVANGDAIRPGLSEAALAPYLPYLEIFEEPIRRHNNTWSKPPTADGTASLMTLYAINDVRSGNKKLSESARKNIKEQTEEDLPFATYEEVFDYAGSLVKGQLPKMGVLTARVLAFAQLAEAADQASDGETRREQLQKAMDALRAYRDWQPELYSTLHSDLRLSWLFNTEEYKQWKTATR